jgi:hypothetical protein
MKKSLALGFHFDMSKVISQIAVVQAVLLQYLKLAGRLKDNPVAREFVIRMLQELK